MPERSFCQKLLNEQRAFIIWCLLPSLLLWAGVNKTCFGESWTCGLSHKQASWAQSTRFAELRQSYTWKKKKSENKVSRAILYAPWCLVRCPRSPNADNFLGLRNGAQNYTDTYQCKPDHCMGLSHEQGSKLCRHILGVFKLYFL